MGIRRGGTIRNNQTDLAFAGRALKNYTLAEKIRKKRVARLVSKSLNNHGPWAAGRATTASLDLIFYGLVTKAWISTAAWGVPRPVT
jgi:hypothetical protein